MKPRQGFRRQYDLIIMFDKQLQHMREQLNQDVYGTINERPRELWEVGIGFRLSELR